ncbi:MAG: hypothetical protein QGH79_11490, partial [SAR324 cluster bacterium]|nr:hypothetical protein [SAR324 cluster bacterium]
QGGMVPTAIYHHALLGLVLHLLQLKRIADHIAGQLAAALPIVLSNTETKVKNKDLRRNKESVVLVYAIRGVKILEEDFNGLNND